MADVRALLGRWYPGQQVTAERMGSGGSTPVYRVTVSEVVSYLRLAEHPGEVNDGEVRAHELALARGVRVPAILRWEAQPPELDRSAALTSAMPGIPLAEVAGDSAAVIQGWARDGALLNAIPVRGFGWVTGVSGADDLVAEHPTRSAWAAEYRGALATVLAADVFPEAVSRKLTRLVEAWCDLPDADVSWLAHGDLDSSHVYVDEVTGAYVGLIDLGEIRGADALYDLGHAMAHSFAGRDQSLVAALLRERAMLSQLDGEAVRMQAVAIAVRALAIQLGRPENGYRTALITRLEDLLQGVFLAN